MKITVPVVDVKFAPAMVMDVPGRPLGGVKLEMTGATVNDGPVALTPPGRVTTTAPVVAPEGTTTTI